MINKSFVPFPTLETDRLLLRLVEDTDVEQLLNMDLLLHGLSDLIRHIRGEHP